MQLSEKTPLLPACLLLGAYPRRWGRYPQHHAPVCDGGSAGGSCREAVLLLQPAQRRVYLPGGPCHEGLPRGTNLVPLTRHLPHQPTLLAPRAALSLVPRCAQAAALGRTQIRGSYGAPTPA